MPGQETLYFNGNIVTLDPELPRAEAMVVADGAIQAIGAGVDLSSRGQRKVDLGGATAIPGFDDSHMHVLSMGLGLGQVDVAPALSIGELVKRVQERVAVTAPGSWVLGRGYNQNLLHERRHPTRDDLDAVSPVHPVALWHTSGHALTTNSEALRLAGIGPDTAPPEAGEIDRDATGYPTGVLKENAMSLLRSVVPSPSPRESRDAILAASRALAAEGITSASDAATGQHGRLEDSIEGYRLALESGSLITRLTLMPLIESVTGAARRTPSDLDLGTKPAWLSTGAAKIFTDGALTTRTAALRQPYADSSGAGILIWRDDDLLRVMREAVASGWRLATHAIGDRALEQVIAAYEQIGQGKEARARVEHATICDHLLVARMRNVGAVAVLQPEDIAVLGDAYPPALGSARAGDNSPVRWFAEAGVPIAFSSDRPVTPGHPLTGVRAAVERRTVSGRVLGGEHRIDAEIAIGYYTAGSAYATRHEGLKGRLKAGFRADFVVLDRDITSCPSEAITEATVQRTFVDGRQVFEGR